MQSFNRFLHAGAAVAAALVSASLAEPAGAQGSWVQWTEETGTRIAGDASVTTADTMEKDLAVGDLDNDGDDDIVVARKVPFSNPGGMPNVLLMNEGGVLTDRTAELAPDLAIADDARDVVLFDADGNGWLDILTVNTFFEQPRLFRNLGKDASGTFLGFAEDTDWFSPLFSPGPKFCAASAGDVTGNGFPDLFFSDYESPLEDRLLVNDGTGNFVDESELRLGTQLMESAFGTGNVIHDFNGNGAADIVKISTLFSPSVLRLLVNRGDGFFETFQDLPFDSVYMLDAADFNNDGRMDLYVVSDNQDYQLINDSTNPDGTISVTTITVTGSPKTAGFGGNVHSADVDRDGWIDVGVADVDVDIPGCSRRFAVLRNAKGVTGADGLSDPNGSAILPWNTQGNHDFVWIDLDGNGFLDIVQGTCDGLRVFTMVPFASAVPFGTGCAGSAGTPSIGDIGAPQLGNSTYVVNLEGALPGVLPVLLLGLSPAEIDLGAGCELLVGPPFLDPIMAGPTSPEGTTRVVLPVPSSPALEGLRVHAQWGTPDPAGPIAGGWAATQGLEIYLSSTALP